MKVVSNNSEKEIAARRALKRIQWLLTDLGANMVRVIRGAGRAYELPVQMDKVLEAFEQYREAVGYYPSSDEISAALSLRRRNAERKYDEMQWATDRMVQGALQIAASQLLGQTTQEAAGDTELFDGIAALERWRESQRRTFTSNRRAAKTKRKVGKSKEADSLANYVNKG